MKNVTSIYRGILVLVSCLPVLKMSAQDINPIEKSWESGPLTWNDFQVRHVPDNSLYFSNLTAFLYDRYERRRDGNLVYDICIVKNEMSPTSSWYDPEKCTDWTLRYEQTRFDIMEVFRRLAQNQYFYDPLTKEFKRHNYSNSVYETIRTFDQESKYGADTLVVQEYERIYRKKLDSIAIKPQSKPFFRTRKLGLEYVLGPEMEYFLTQVPNNMSLACGCELGMYLNYKRCLWGFNFSCNNSGEPESNGFYYDPKYNYSWKKGRKVELSKFTFNLGYKILDNARWSIAPIIGIGSCDFSQETDTPIDDNYYGYESSSISGTRIETGVILDWKHRRYISRITDMYMESKIRFQINGARTVFDVIGNSYSINLKLQYTLGMWDLL